MKFIDVLITNTKNGSMDFMWKYVGSKEHGRYSIQKPKYILSGLNLDSDPKVGEIIFPNGLAVNHDESKMTELIEAVRGSLYGTVGKIVKVYDVNTEEVEEPVVDGGDEESEDKPEDDTEDAETEDKDNGSEE